MFFLPPPASPSPLAPTVAVAELVAVEEILIIMKEKNANQI